MRIPAGIGPRSPRSIFLTNAAGRVQNPPKRNEFHPFLPLAPAIPVRSVRRGRVGEKGNPCFQFAKDDTNMERFRREAKATAAIQYAHIVQIHDYGEQDGIFYCVMELIHGHKPLGSGTDSEENKCTEIASNL